MVHGLLSSVETPNLGSMGTHKSDKQNDRRKDDRGTHAHVNQVDGRESDELVQRNSTDSRAATNTPTELFNLIKLEKWADVVARVVTHPEEASTWVIERNSDDTFQWKLLPLHQACELDPTVGAVKALVDAYPDAILEKDSEGDIPLHLACRERAQKDVIDTLLLSNADTAKIADNEGRLSLHLACRQGAGLEIVNNLLVTYHKGAQKQDNYGLLPLHWACAQNSTGSVVETLLRAHPDGVNAIDKWGRSPMALAQASTNPDKKAVIEALNQDASYWTNSLLKEVADLKMKLECKETKEINVRNKAMDLEAKLFEVTSSSSAAAASFKELTKELQVENADLEEEIKGLRARKMESDMKIERLERQNNELKDKVTDMTNKLEALSGLFQSMEDQRLLILRATGEWEDTLQQASDLFVANEDYGDAKKDMSPNV